MLEIVFLKKASILSVFLTLYSDMALQQWSLFQINFHLLIQIMGNMMAQNQVINVPQLLKSVIELALAVMVLYSLNVPHAMMDGL